MIISTTRLLFSSKLYLILLLSTSGITLLIFTTRYGTSLLLPYKSVTRTTPLVSLSNVFEIDNLSALNTQPSVGAINSSSALIVTITSLLVRSLSLLVFTVIPVTSLSIPFTV